jgi:hypothetical protein
MANYRAVASGNWSNGATWAGGSVPPNNEGHGIYSNNFTVTIDTNVNVNIITNASNAGTFVGGGTAAAGGGFTVSASGLVVTANISGYNSNTTTPLTYTGGSGSTLVINGNLAGFNTFSNWLGAVNSTGGGTLTINGNVSSNVSGQYYSAGLLINGGVCTLNGNISCVDGHPSSVLGTNGNPAVYVRSGGSLTVNNGTLTGGNNNSNNSTAIHFSSSGGLTLNNCIVNAGIASPAVVVSSGSVFLNMGVFSASNSVVAISASFLTGRGTFVHSPNGTNPFGGARIVLGAIPSNSYTQYALDGINANSFVRYYTADNALGQANPTDVRSGVSYASGNLTGRLTVPARGSVALSVNYGPSMPFTATRSGTTATATMAYSYPLVVGDQITVTGASNTEWNDSYTIASVVSGTSVTFAVPNTHSATAGTGANMQTTGTAVLDPTAVASAVWGAASRTITGGTVDTLTNAPASVTPADIWDYNSRTLTSASGPTAVEIRQEIDANSTKLDVAVGTRLADADYVEPANSDVAAIKAKTDALPSDPADQSLLEAAIAGVTAPAAATVAAAVRSELSVELARVDQAVSSRLAASEASKLDAVKAKTDLLQTDRLAQCSTVATTGAQLAAALS